MNTARSTLRLGLLSLGIIAGPNALAQDPGWYLGANAGQSKSKIDDARISRSLLVQGLDTTSLADRDHDTGFKVFGGYQFNRYFSLEGGYFDLGAFGFTATTVPAGTLDGSLKVKGFLFGPVLSLPFTRKFSGFLRAGLTHSESKAAFSGTGSVAVLEPSAARRGLNGQFGAGLQYDFTRNFGMRLEVERYRVNDAAGNKGDIDLASAGILVRFGRKAATTAAYVPVPEPAAPAPVAPIVVAEVSAPVPARTEDYCTILELTFEIDRDTIERDDLEKLSVVGTFLTKYPGSTAIIEGHTDNVGTELHNQALSQKRAESVVNYLVDTIHVDRSRLSAVGYGSANPLADNATEDGKRQNRRINAVVSCVSDIEGLTVAPARMTLAMVIEFDLLKDEVKPEHREQLRKVANFLKANPTLTATVEGHAGTVRTTDASAMEISKRRADNVVTYLVENFGLERSRLTAEGFGRTRRFAYSATPEGQQENRRVGIVINYPKK